MKKSGIYVDRRKYNRSLLYLDFNNPTDEGRIFWYALTELKNYSGVLTYFNSSCLMDTEIIVKAIFLEECGLPTYEEVKNKYPEYFI